MKPSLMSSIHPLLRVQHLLRLRNTCFAASSSRQFSAVSSKPTNGSSLRKLNFDYRISTTNYRMYSAATAGSEAAKVDEAAKLIGNEESSNFIMRIVRDIHGRPYPGNGGSWTDTFLQMGMWGAFFICVSFGLVSTVWGAYLFQLWWQRGEATLNPQSYAIAKDRTEFGQRDAYR